jgi:hypothetical protein
MDGQPDNVKVARETFDVCGEELKYVMEVGK